MQTKVKARLSRWKAKICFTSPLPSFPPFFFFLSFFFFFDSTAAAKQSFKFTSCYNGRGHISEPCAALEQHQRAQNKARTVHTELTQAYIILDCNLSQSWKWCTQNHTDKKAGRLAAVVGVSSVSALSCRSEINVTIWSWPNHIWQKKSESILF